MSEVGEDGLLRRKCGEHLHLVLPKLFQPLVYKELHQEMGRLGVGRVLQLAHERFYWPYMQHDITHFVTRVCSCLKQRHPNVNTRAPSVKRFCNTLGASVKRFCSTLLSVTLLL